MFVLLYIHFYIQVQWDSQYLRLGGVAMHNYIIMGAQSGLYVLSTPHGVYRVIMMSSVKYSHHNWLNQNPFLKLHVSNVRPNLSELHL